MPHRLPLHEAHVAAGAELATVCDWEIPASYGDPAAEYAAVRHAVGVIDRGDHGVVEVAGRDRATFLHALLSNEVKALSPGQGCAATLLDVHGKVQVILRVLVLDDRIVMIAPPAHAGPTVEALDRYLFSEKVGLEDVTRNYALLLLAGPQAPALVERLTGARPAEAAWSHVAAKLEAVDVRLVRGGGESGEAEVWLMSAAEDARRVWDAALAAGARPIGFTAQESLRIETGTPLLGHDVDGTVLLPEIPFERLVSYTKGCYPGQEVVVRIRDRGHVNRLLRGLVVEGSAGPAPGAEIVRDAPAAGEAASGERAPVGRVTSATWSLGLDRPIALGFVRRQHAEPGARVAVRVGDTMAAATVCALPFTRPAAPPAAAS